MTFNFVSLKKEKDSLGSQLKVAANIDPVSTKVELLNRKITLTSDLEIIRSIHRACNENKKMTVASYNVHSFNLSMQIPWFYEFQETADITRCDGFGILKALNCMGLNVPLHYRVSGTKLAPKLIDYSSKNNLSVFLLGAKPEILARAIYVLKKQYPPLRVFGHHGYFDKSNIEENQIVIDQINQVQPNILIVGMGVPLQERWLLTNRPYIDANVFFPCGAVIDRLAGIITPCPTWLSNSGFEWLHRLMCEPKRLAARYLLGNPALFFHVFLAKSLHLSDLDRKQTVNSPSSCPLEYKI